jgi:hypothetical protein
MPKHDPYDSAKSDDGSSATGEVASTNKKERTPEQEAAVRRHLRFQDDQRSGDEATDGGAFSSITNTSAGIILRVGLMVIRASVGMAFGGSGSKDVNLRIPIGLIGIIVGALICCLGFAVWAVATLCLTIYRAISG